ncbi:hypothetical protein F-S17_0061 [Faustovirus]|nr:hypothetical protein F-S17_0061 [Faustovirus]
MKCRIIRSNTGQIVYFTVASFVSLVTLGVAITFLVLRYGQPELYVGLITNVLAFWAKPPKFEGFLENRDKTVQDAMPGASNGNNAINDNDLESGAATQNGTEIEMESK